MIHQKGINTPWLITWRITRLIITTKCLPSLPSGVIGVTSTDQHNFIYCKSLENFKGLLTIFQATGQNWLSIPATLYSFWQNLMLFNKSIIGCWQNALTYKYIPRPWSQHHPSMELDRPRLWYSFFLILNLYQYLSIL